MKIKSTDPWREVSNANGIQVVEIPDFEAFCKFVNAGFGDSDCSYLWRGQKCAAWEITSGLTRATGKQKEDILKRFQIAAGRHIETKFDVSDGNPKQEQQERELWSLGQHYGLLTPLTDWTEYPYVALFFAFAEADPPGKVNKCNLTNCPTAKTQDRNDTARCDFRAVFALDTKEIQDVQFENVETKGMKPFMEQLNHPPYSDDFKRHLLSNFPFVKAELVRESSVPVEVRNRIRDIQNERLKKQQLRVYRPGIHENRRIHSQRGWHVISPVNSSVEDWVRASYDFQVSEYPMLVKIIIPNGQRNPVLKCLNKMGVNYLNLFPDLEGAARHCNMGLHEGEFFGLRDY
jgi:hypothetical protein